MTGKVAEVVVRLRDQASGTSKKIAGGLRGIADGASDIGKKSGEVNKLATALDKANAAAKKVGDFRSAKQGFSEANRAFREAEANVRRIGKAMAEAETPTRKLESSYRRAQAAVKAASAEVDRQRAAFASAKGALNEFGIGVSNLASQEARLKSSIEQTTAALKRQEAVEASAHAQATARMERRNRIGNAVLGLGAAHKGKQFGRSAVESVAEFDIATRKQREFVDIDPEMQRKVLLPQAKKIGQDTQFSNTDVVKAQTKAMQGLPPEFSAKLRAEVGAGIIESVKNYALVMEADMEQSAEAIRSFLQTTRKDISSKEKAIAEATRATNLMVKMAKLGGMSDEDVQQFMKYGAATGTAAGLSDSTMGALGAVARRGGLRGDEAGVFMRSAASKLVAPTKKGREALITAGIDFDKYTKMPGGMSVENLEKFSKERFGKGFDDSQKGRIADLMENGDVVGNREEFIKQISEIVSESFDKKKDGKTKAQDAQKIAKMVGDFQKLSVESVDTEGLLSAIMNNPKMSIGLLNAFFTDKHGGKASILASMFGDFKNNKQQLDAVGNDPDFAKRKADEIMGGIGGELERLKGSVQNLTLAFGEANAGWLQVGMKGIGTALDSISNLSPAAQQAATALGLVAAAYGAFKGAQALMGGFGLNASAVALTESAAALNVAAGRLAMGGAAGAAGSAAGTAASAATGAAGASGAAATASKGAGIASKIGPLLGKLGLWGAAASGVYEVTAPIREANEKRFEGVAPGEEHNQGKAKMKAANEAARQRLLETRRQVEGEPITDSLLEQSRQKQEAWKADPEAARGRAMIQSSGGSTTPQAAISDAKVGGDSKSTGAAAGQEVGQGIKEGLAGAQGAIEAQANAIMAALKSKFAAGIDVPVRAKLEGSGLRGVHADAGI